MVNWSCMAGVPDSPQDQETSIFYIVPRNSLVSSPSLPSRSPASKLRCFAVQNTAFKQFALAGLCNMVSRKCPKDYSVTLAKSWEFTQQHKLVVRATSPGIPLHQSSRFFSHGGTRMDRLLVGLKHATEPWCFYEVSVSGAF